MDNLDNLLKSSLEEVLKVAKLACQKCEYENALKLYTMVINKDPNNWEYYVERSMINIYLRKYEEALFDSEVSIRINPSNYKGHYQCGISFRQLGRYYKASVAFSKAVVLDPDNKLYLTGLIDAALKSPLRDTLSIIMGQLEEMKLGKNPFVVLSVIGQDLLAHDQALHAVEVLQCALVVGTKSAKLKGSVFSALGSAFWSLEKHDKAIHYMNEDLKISELFQDKSNQCRAHGNLGAAYLILQSYEKALDSHHKQLNFARQTNNVKSIVVALSGLGLASTALGRHTDALNYHQLAAQESADDVIAASRELGKAAASCSALGDMEQALKFHQKRLEILDSKKDMRTSTYYIEELEVLNDLATTYKELKRINDELLCLRRSVEISSDLKDSSHEIKTLINLAFASKTYGNLTEAISCYERLLGIAITNDDKTLEARTYSYLGRIHHQCGDYEKTLAAQNNYLRLAIDNNDISAQGRAHCSIGNTYTAMGLYEQALKHHQQELEISIWMGDKNSECGTHGNLAVAYQALHQNNLAIKHYCQQLEIAQQIGSVENESRALINVGNFYNFLDQYEQAIAAYQRYLTITSSTSYQTSSGRVLYNLGFAYYQLKQYEKAVGCYQQSVNVADHSNDQIALARASCNLGLAHKQLGQYSSALDCQRRFLAISKDLNSIRGTFKALGNLGDLYSERKEPELAIEAYSQQLDLAREVDEVGLVVQALASLGTSLRSCGQFERALSFHREEVDLYQKSLKDFKNEYRAQGRLGATLTTLGQVNEAKKCYQRQVELTRGDHASKKRVMRAWSNLAIAHSNLQEYEEAVSCLQHQVSLFAADDVSSLSRCEHCIAFCRLGDCLVALNKFEQAADAYQDAFKVVEHVDNFELTDRCLEGAVGALNMSHRLDDAIICATKRVQYTENARDLYANAAACGDLGVLLSEVGEHEKSVKMLREQMRLGLEIGDEQIKADAACALGNAYLLVENFSTSIEFHKLDLEIAMNQCNRPYQGRAHSNLAIVYEKSLDHVSALSSQEQHLFIAKEENDEVAKVTALQGIARNMLMIGGQDYTKAIPLLQQALFYSKDLIESLINTFILMTRVYWSCNDLKRALDQITEAIQQIEANPDHLSISLIQSAHTLYLACLFENSKFEEALLVAEKVRSGNSDLVFDDVTESVREADSPLLQYYVAMNRFVYVWLLLPQQGLAYCKCHVITSDTSLGDQISCLRVSVGVDTGEQLTSNPKYRKRKSRFSVHDHLLVSADGDLPKTSTKQIDVKQWKSTIHALDEILTGSDITQLIKSSTKLSIIADDLLIFVPFSLLKRSPTDPYLSQRLHLQQATSLTQHFSCSDRDFISQPLLDASLVIGNPSLPPEVIRFLPTSTGEEEIALMTSLTRTEAMVGGQVTRMQVIDRMTRSEHVHLACPLALWTDCCGVVVSDGVHVTVPATPSVELSNREEDRKSCVTVEEPTYDDLSDFLLTPDQIQSLDLSSCKLITIGSPHLLPSSGDFDQLTSSLRRIAIAFLTAGAASCLFSMWPVPHSAYRLFLHHLHTLLAQRKQLFEAFNAARDHLRATDHFAHPSYWAGFVLIGREVALKGCALTHALAVVLSEQKPRDTFQLASDFVTKALDSPHQFVYRLQQSVTSSLGSYSIGWRKFLSAAGFQLKSSDHQGPDAIFFPKSDARSQLETVQTVLRFMLGLSDDLLIIISQLLINQVSVFCLHWLQSDLLPWMENKGSEVPQLPTNLENEEEVMKLLIYIGINPKDMRLNSGSSEICMRLQKCLQALRLVSTKDSDHFLDQNDPIVDQMKKRRSLAISNPSSSFRSKIVSSNISFKTPSNISNQHPILPSMFRLIDASNIQPQDTNSLSSDHRIDESLLSDIDTKTEECGILNVEEPRVFTHIPMGTKLIAPKPLLPSKSTAFSEVKSTPSSSFQLAPGSIESLLYSRSPSMLVPLARKPRTLLSDNPQNPFESSEPASFYSNKIFAGSSYFGSSSSHHLPKICVVSPQREEPDPTSSEHPTRVRTPPLKTSSAVFGVVASQSVNESVKSLEIQKLHISSRGPVFSTTRSVSSTRSLASNSSTGSSKSEPIKSKEQRNRKTAEILRRLSSRNKNEKLGIENEKIEFV